MYEQPSRINCSIWSGCFPETLRRCLIEQVCQGSKVLSGLRNPEDWILRYIRKYPLTLLVCIYMLCAYY